MMPPNLPDKSFLHDEQWEKLPVDGYYLSSRGRIWNDDAKRFLRPSNTQARPKPPILFISINKRKRYVAPLGRTVLTMFGSPSPGGRSYVCRHKDGDPFNNQIENLEWIKGGTCTNVSGVSNAKFTGGRSWSTLYDIADGPMASCSRFGGDDVTKPIISIGSGTTRKDGPICGEFNMEWQEGYLESIPEGVVELASTESNGVRYRFCVERVVE
jgi:hypothetical protein